MRRYACKAATGRYVRGPRHLHSAPYYVDVDVQPPHIHIFLLLPALCPVAGFPTLTHTHSRCSPSMPRSARLIHALSLGLATNSFKPPDHSPIHCIDAGCVICPFSPHPPVPPAQAIWDPSMVPISTSDPYQAARHSEACFSPTPRDKRMIAMHLLPVRGKPWPIAALSPSEWCVPTTDLH